MEKLIEASIAAVRDERWEDCINLCHQLRGHEEFQRVRFSVSRRLMVALFMSVETDITRDEKLLRLNEAISLGIDSLAHAGLGLQEWASIHRDLANAYTRYARLTGAKDEDLRKVVTHCEHALEVEYSDDALRTSIQVRLAYALMTITGGDVRGEEFRGNLRRARALMLQSLAVFNAGGHVEEAAEVFSALRKVNDRLSRFFGEDGA
jgi:hypothetical protein